MKKISKKWVNRMNVGKSKEISREFFHTYHTQEEVTKSVYPKAFAMRKKKSRKNFIMPLVTARVKEWKGNGFFDKSIPLKKDVFRKGKKHKQTFYLSLMNLEPVYKFSKEMGITFTDEEKSYLKLLLLNDKIRKLILNEFPEEDVINATLKFYVKNIINKYFFYLRDIHENPSKYKEQYEKLGKIRKLSNKLKDFNIIKIISYDVNKNTSLDIMFRHYLSYLEIKKEVVTSVDNKILEVLRILPS